jgi:hypothetical protein
MASNAFRQLKKTLMKASVLNLPTQDEFQLYILKKKGLVLGVVTQHWDPWTSGYLSKEVDQVAKGWLGCLKVIPETQKLLLGSQSPDSLHSMCCRGNSKFQGTLMAAWQLPPQVSGTFPRKIWDHLMSLSKPQLCLLSAWGWKETWTLMQEWINGMLCY